MRRLSFMTAVTTTRFDERRTTTFGLVGGITFCESMVPLISPPFTRTCSCNPTRLAS
uniref:Uncharacterized protein n=1 Tax=Ralstonia solanacearum TaxID=305 RepID=A0A0S4TPC1_RALSL|nr:protein of unknown function [Ralstonia solanacearum]